MRFTFDSREIEGYGGESVAAALWAAGVRHWAGVDPRADVQPSADVHHPADMHHPADEHPSVGDSMPASPPARTLFCAMGVCQQCALWIDGRRIESCRVTVRDGLDVRTTPGPRLPASLSPALDRDPPEFDVIVAGAGPAGAAAAIEAHARGLRVALVDEASAAGGQVHRIAPGIGDDRQTADRTEGDALRVGLAGVDIVRYSDARMWSVERVAERWHVHALDAGGAFTLRARTLIVATGALERHQPFEGWDRPGVIGLAAATVLLKAQRMLPGREVIVAGTGPLLFLVATSILAAGGRVVAVVDARPRAAWLAQVGALASRPDLVARGLRWRRTLRRHGVPLYASHLVTSVTGEPPWLAVRVVALDGDGKPRDDRAPLVLRADAVCVGFGLMPATDVTRLAGATHAHATARGGWHVAVDDDQRCDRPDLFAAGDGAGVAGAAAAPLQGRIAALAAARALGRIDESTYRDVARRIKQERDAAARFGAAMTRIATVADGTLAAIAPATRVCLCEGLTRATIDTAIDDGCTTSSELRTATRCGMGPCGGRLCEDTAARLIALRATRSREEVGQATGRPPLRPVELDVLAGTFDYETLPIAAPVPL